jgi:hypothetical protein
MRISVAVGGGTVRRFLLQIGSVTLLAVTGAYLLALWVGVSAPSLTGSFFVFVLTLVGFGSMAALVGYVLWLWLWEREPNPRPRIVGVVKQCFAPAFLGRRLAPLLLTFVFLGAFGSFKASIPYVHPFAWDGFLSDLDRAIFGTDPWRITHALIGATGTRIIDIFYGLWFVEWVVAIIYFSLFAGVHLQRRFFLSFLAVWMLLGIALATLFSSVGPCFLDLIGHPYASRYAELFPINGAPGAMMAQSMLAAGYRTQSIGAFQGISAMPSVHIAVCALLVLASRHLGRWALAVAILFYGIIFLGSVHLGWHYVSDGVVGSLGALAIWRATRPKPVEAAPSAERTRLAT